MAKYRKLGRTSSQRKALMRNQVTQLLYHGRIITTEARAKEIRKWTEKLIALAVKEVVDGKKTTVYDEVDKTIKKDLPSRLHARRQMLQILYPVTEVPQELAGRKKNTKKVDLPAKLFDEIAPKYVDRKGGYTRIVKIGERKGDGAMEVVIELV